MTIRRILCLALSALAMWAAPVACAEEEALIGPVLVGDFGRAAELISLEQGEDGAYDEVLLVDGMVTIRSGREAASAVGAAERALALYPDAREVQALEGRVVAAYPAEHIRFLAGQNEDTARVDMLWIPTDAWNFYAIIRVPVDSEELYADLVDYWLESVDLFDAAEAFASAEGGLTWEAASAYTEAFGGSDLGTVGDVIAQFAPTHFTWWYPDDGSGRTLMEMDLGSGILALNLADAHEFLTPEMGMDGATDIPAEVYEMTPALAYIVWDAPEFPIAPVAGIPVGDEMARALSALPGGQEFEIDPAGGSGYDQRIEYVVPNPNQAGGQADYFLLTYYGAEGIIQSISLQYCAE